LEEVDFSWRIQSLGFAAVGALLTGIKVQYFTGKELTHGVYKAGTEVWRCPVRSDLIVAKLSAGKVKEGDAGHVRAVEFIRANEGGQLPQWSLDVATLRYVPEQPATGLVERSSIVELAPVVGNSSWSVRGFYGEVLEGENPVISRLGVIWGRG
jgi:hypothetical protein